VGEAPGRNEDLQGKPFVGKAGGILRECIEDIGFPKNKTAFDNAVKCLTYNSVVVMADGSRKLIGDIVENKEQGEVLSVDRNNELIPSKITNWYKSKRHNQNLIKVSYENTRGVPNGIRGVTVTENHQILTKRGWKQTKDLKSDEVIATGEIGISEKVKEFLIGCVLGDGYIGSRDPRPHFATSTINLEYAECKNRILKALNSKLTTLNKDLSKGRPNNVYNIRTESLACLVEWRKCWYPFNQKIIPKDLKLTPFSLAVWWLDDGCAKQRRGKQTTGELTTCGFSKEEVMFAITKLRAMGIEASLWNSKAGPRIGISVKGMKALSAIIGSYVPKSMRYKILKGAPKFNPKLWVDDSRPVHWEPVKINKVSDKILSKTYSVYCLDIKDTHNFVTVGGVVHNCWPGMGNPTPKDKEIRACRPHLKDTIDKLKPKVVVMLGAVALKSVTGKTGITKLRGTAWLEDGIYYVPTFHPALIFRDETKLKPLYHDLELAFSLPDEGLPEVSSNKNWFISSSEEESIEILDILKEVEEDITYDIETSTLYPWEKDPKILTIAYCVDTKTAYCIPVYKKDAPYSKGGGDRVLAKIIEMQEYRNAKGYGFQAYNSPYDMGYSLAVHDIPLPILNFDPYSAHHLIDEEMKKPSLSQLAWIYTDMGGYDRDLEAYKKNNPDTCDPGRGGSYDNIPLDILGNYNCGDVIVTRLLAEKFVKLLEEEDLLNLYEEISREVAYPLVDFFLNGFAVNKQFLEQLMDEYSIRMNELIREARDLPDVKKYEKRLSRRMKKEWQTKENNRLAEGKRPRKKMIIHTKAFNPGSDQQVAEVLFDIAKFLPVKSTPSGRPSVDKEVRAALSGLHPLVDYVDEYNRFKKFYGTYVVRINKHLQQNNLFHPSYDMTGTVTGRLVSDIQQLPRGDKNKDIKRMFVSRFPNGGLFNGDIAGAELRMFAIVSGDEALTEIFQNDQDPHSMAACLVYNLDYDDFMYRLQNGDQKAITLRNNMKSAVSFGLVYGREADALARDFGWAITKAQKFKDDYFNNFSGVWDYIQKTKRFAIRKGYVKNPLGRIRRVGEAMNSTDKMAQERALRQAVNFIIQSGLHDLVFRSLVEVWKQFYAFNLKSLLIGEVHDSIIADYYDEDELEIIVSITKDIVEDQLPKIYDWITVPMKLDPEYGPNLMDLQKYSGTT
jgi:uracil-DNA glycosylase family 4